MGEKEHPYVEMRMPVCSKDNIQMTVTFLVW